MPEGTRPKPPALRRLHAILLQPRSLQTAVDESRRLAALIAYGLTRRSAFTQLSDL
jgi:hypothetical protein